MARNTPDLVHPNAPLYPLDRAKADEVVADTQDNVSPFLLEEAGIMLRRGTPYARLISELGYVVAGVGPAHQTAFGVGSLLAHRLARQASTHEQPLPRLTESGYYDLVSVAIKHVTGFVERAIDAMTTPRRPRVESEDGLPSRISPDDPDLDPIHSLWQGFGPFLEAEPDILAVTNTWRADRFDPPREALNLGAAVALGGLHVAAQSPRRTA